MPGSTSAQAAVAVVYLTNGHAHQFVEAAEVQTLATWVAAHKAQ